MACRQSSAGTLICLSLLLLLLLLSTCSGLYEDQIKKFDWQVSQTSTLTIY